VHFRIVGNLENSRQLPIEAKNELKRKMNLSNTPINTLTYDKAVDSIELSAYKIETAFLFTLEVSSRSGSIGMLVSHWEVQ